MKRRGLVGGGWRRIAAASSSLFVALALAPATSALPLPVAAAAPATTSAQIAASSNSAQPELATYAGAPAAGKPTDVAQQPFGLAVSGRYTFVADPVNHLVRLLIDNSELVFAGNGSLASEGDGKDLALSQLVGPYAVAVGHVCQQGFQVTAFDVYIADTFANKIKKVKVTVPRINNASDVQTVDLSTLAGSGDFGFSGDGSTGADLPKAQFNSPYGLAWDGSRQVLYVADTLNNRIRAIHDPIQPTADACLPVPAPVPADLKTVLGQDPSLPAGLQVHLNHPRGLATDSAGRLYIADTYNNAIVLYDPGDPNAKPPVPKASLFAGTGAPGYSGDGQAATKGKLQRPSGVAVDSQGNLYIADTGNNVVREVVSAGNLLQTVAGTGKPGKFGDGGPAILSQLSAPMAVAVRPNGDVAIADTGNNQVRVLEARLSGPTHNIHLEAGNGTPSFAGDGQSPSKAQFAGPAAVLSQLFDGSATTTMSSARTPNAAVPAVAGQRYVLDTFNQALRAYATPDNGTAGANDDISTLAGLGGVRGSAQGSKATEARFANPMGMAFDASGTKLYVADTFNNVVRRVDLSASPRKVETIAGTAGVSGYGGDGDLATKSTLSYPAGVAVDKAGNVFIADSYNGVVREVLASSKRIYTVAGTGRLGFSGEGGPATKAGLYFPYGVAVDASAPPTLFITDSFDHRVRRVDAVSPLDLKTGKAFDRSAKNTITTVAGSAWDDETKAFADGAAIPTASGAPSALFDRPWSTTLSQGGLVVADYLNNRLRRVDLASGTVTTLAGTGRAGLNNGTRPTGLQPDGAPSGLPADSGPAASGELNGVRAVSTLGDSGALLLADSFNNRVRWFGQTQSGIQRTEVNFDATNLAGTSQPQSVTVSSTGSGLLVMGSVGLRADKDNFVLDPKTNTCVLARLEPGNSCFFQVAFQPRAPGGHSGSVVIPNDALGGAQMIRLTGQATAALVGFSPPAVSIFQPTNGTPAPAVVTLTNNGDGVLHIDDIGLQNGSHSDFSQSNNCPSSMPAHSTCQITIMLNQIGPSDLAARTDTLVVRDDAAGNSITTQTVPLTGSLAQASASFNRQSLTFTQNLGSSSGPQIFTLRNGGQVPLHLSGIRDDGDFAQTNNCPQVLSPGASCAISVSFIPSTLGERDGYIVVADDSPDSPQKIAVTGVATMALAQLGPDRLNFSQNVGATSAQQTVTLFNRGDGPLNIAAISATGDFKAFPHCPSVLLPGISCSVGVAFAPQASGVRKGSLVVTDDATAAPGTDQSVRLSGTAYQPVAGLATTSLSPGANLGSSAGPQTVAVTNTGDGVLTIRSIGIAGAAAGDYRQSNNCVRAIQPGGSCSITVNFIPHAYGIRAATLTLVDDGLGGTQSVALRGTGTAPRPLLSSGFLNFGGAGLGGASAPQTIVLFNAGNGPLSIGSINVIGDDFFMTTNCGTSLAAGGSCRISVSFRPRVTGARSGVVTITDNAGSQRFTLSGVGT